LPGWRAKGSSLALDGVSTPFQMPLPDNIIHSLQLPNVFHEALSASYRPCAITISRLKRPFEVWMAMGAKNVVLN
jgi:hypothetical protein